MTRFTPPPAPIVPIVLGLVATACCWPTASSAQSTSAPITTEATQAAPGDTIRLTDEQRMKILDTNTAESAAAARGELTGSGMAGRGIHGEIGAMIGSHGTRGIYGVADIPLGENGSATVAVESSRYGYRR